MISRRIYLLIVLVIPAIVVAGPAVWDFFGFVKQCPGRGYSSDRYLAYCDSERFGDYEHGAFYLDTEPQAIAAAKSADVVVLGNSRMLIGLSTRATEQYFEGGKPTAYYLLGFGYGENFLFPMAVMEKLHLSPKVLIVNIDDRFFLPTESPPARFVRSLRDARGKYQGKVQKQFLHRVFCESTSFNPGFCGDFGSVFRSRRNGFWYTEVFRKSENTPVAISPTVDAKTVDRLVPGGIDFLNQVRTKKECVVFVNTPLPDWSDGSAAELAHRLGVRYVGARDHDWKTLDGSHLVPESAERWSAQVLPQLTSMLKDCGA